MSDPVPVTHAFTRPNILSLLDFKDADFLEPESSDVLSNTDPEAALADMLEKSELASCGDVGAYLGTTTVFLSLKAYRRIPFGDSYTKAWTETLVEHLREYFGDEEGADDRLSDDDTKELHARMSATVNWYLARVKYFPCQVVRTWRFDNADLRELVQQLMPEWLESKA